MVNMRIDAMLKKSVISKEIYGHFSEHLGRCIYNGIYVGEDSDIPNTNGMRNDVVVSLRKIRIPVLRWPGGCFADEYHWKDGIGPKENRKKMINSHWGGCVEDNSFGTHEFMELCRQLDCEPYININVGSGTVAEMAEWIEYLTFGGTSPMAALRASNGHPEPWKVKHIGIGNENWGCGGNMTSEYYSDIYRHYQTYARRNNENKIYKIACGANSFDYDWTDVLMKKAGAFMDGLSLHYYTLPTSNWNMKGPATDFSIMEYYLTLKNTLKMEELIRQHTDIMDRYDPQKRVGLIVDEWGSWYDVEPGTNPGFLYQQNSMRDALITGINLNIFNKHSDRVRMANIAQVVNVLQAVILTEGPNMLLTPTYYVFDMYKVHQGAVLIDSFIETEAIGEGDSAVVNLHESASIDADGNINVTVCNLSAEESFDVCLSLYGRNITKVNATVLTGKFDAHNTFDNPNTVMTENYSEYRL